MGLVVTYADALTEHEMAGRTAVARAPGAFRADPRCVDSVAGPLAKYTIVEPYAHAQ